MHLVLLLGLPVGAGRLARNRWPTAAGRLRQVVQRLGFALLLLLRGTLFSGGFGELRVRPAGSESVRQR